jgi:hypothetical protein
MVKSDGQLRAEDRPPEAEENGPDGTSKQKSNHFLRIIFQVTLSNRFFGF